MNDTFLRESTKFQVVPAPIQVPGTCVSCGSSRTDDRDYIDFGLTLDFVGVIYFCTFCMSECANTIGYISPEQARRLEEQVEYYATQVANFYTKDKALNEAINLLRDSGLFDLITGAASSSDEISSNTINESPESNDPGTNETDQHIKQQDTKQGSSDLSAVRNDELIFGLDL